MEKNPDLNPKYNPSQDSYTYINPCLYQPINLIGELMNTWKPSHLSLTTSLDNIVSSIRHARGQLSNIFEYNSRIREYYLVHFTEEDVKKL
jgi:hypothetical protein